MTLNYNKALEVRYEADVLVAGGGPAGIAAAVMAAEAGAKVIIIEQSGSFGGSGTLGMVPEIIHSLSNLQVPNFHLLNLPRAKSRVLTLKATMVLKSLLSSMRSIPQQVKSCTLHGDRWIISPAFCFGYW